MKNLICYFSATGKTKEVAIKIKEILEGELFCIEPSISYTNEDLDWTNENSRSSVEMKDKHSRPSIKNKIENIQEYQNIFIGFPIWWDLAPTIINTFIESYDLSDKNIFIYATSGSSSIESSFNNLKSTYPNLNFIKAKRLTINTNELEIKDFLNIS